jgi:hypothetical protein
MSRHCVGSSERPEYRVFGGSYAWQCVEVQPVSLRNGGRWGFVTDNVGVAERMDDDVRGGAVQGSDRGQLPPPVGKGG